MTKEEILRELDSFLKETSNPYLSGYSAPFNNTQPDLSNPEFNGFTSDSWIIGGMTGGNCWGDQADRPVTAEEPAELTLLDDFLEKRMPNLSFLEYKKLTKFIKTQEWGKSEYYGNYYEYKCYYITFEDIAECLSN